MFLIRPCLLAGAVVLGSTAVYAQSQDVLKWRANVGTTSNDNFFNAPTAPVTERTTSETLGVTLSLPYSLQRFELDASLVSNQYQTHSDFDFTGTNFNGTWFWSVTPQLHGTLNSTRVEGLTAPTDSLNPTLRNKSVAQTNNLAAAYELGGPWQLTAGVVNGNTVNERTVIGQPDNHFTGVNAGVRYALGSGNSLAYFRQMASGNSSSSYVQTTDDVAVIWVLSGNTTLNSHLAFVQQTFEATPQFNFSGTGGGANVVWRVTGKTSVTAGWQRELASYQANGASYTQTDSFSIAPVWQISPITSLRLQYSSGLLTDQGNPFGTPSIRQDRLQNTALSFSWQPYTKLGLTASVAQSSRSSNIANTDFKAQLVSLAAVFSF